MDPLPDLCFQAFRPTTKAIPNVAVPKSMKNAWLNGPRSIAKLCWHIVSGNPVKQWQACKATVPLEKLLQKNILRPLTILPNKRRWEAALLIAYPHQRIAYRTKFKACLGALLD